LNTHTHTHTHTYTQQSHTHTYPTPTHTHIPNTLTHTHPPHRHTHTLLDVFPNSAVPSGLVVGQPWSQGVGRRSTEPSQLQSHSGTAGQTGLAETTCLWSNLI